MRAGGDQILDIWAKGKLTIKKVSVTGLQGNAVDVPDPYCFFLVTDTNTGKDVEKPQRTATINNECNPSWDLSKPFSFTMSPFRLLTIQVWDANYTIDALMGYKLIPANAVMSGGQYTNFLIHDGDYKISFSVDFTWEPEVIDSTFDWDKLKHDTERAAKEKRTVSIVLEGGGAKGLAYVGPFTVFEEQGIKINRILGTSAGAITALAVAIGMDAQELAETLDEEIDGVPVFATFMDKPTNYMDWEMRKFFASLFGNEFAPTTLLSMNTRTFMPIITRGNVHQGVAVLSWLVGKLDSRGRNASTWTFGQLYKRTGIHFSVTGTDITGKTLRIFNHLTTPNCPLIWAVRISMSIPCVWTPVVWQPAWGKYLNEDISEHVFVDGGLLSNFPIRYLIDYYEPDVIELMGKERSCNVIGLLLDEEKPVPGIVVAESTNTKTTGFTGTFGHLPLMATMQGLMDTVLSSGDALPILQNERSILRLGVQGFGTLEMAMSKEKKAALNRASREATIEFLESMVRDDDAPPPAKVRPAPSRDLKVDVKSDAPAPLLPVAPAASSPATAAVAVSPPQNQRWTFLLIFIAGVLTAYLLGLH